MNPESINKTINYKGSLNYGSNTVLDNKMDSLPSES